MTERWDENLAIVTGQIYKDPKTFTVDGEQECRFVLIHRHHSNEGDIHYFRCRVRGDVADQVQRHMRKGMNVYIRGSSIPQPTFIDDSGTKRTIMYIQVDHIKLIYDDS